MNNTEAHTLNNESDTFPFADESVYVIITNQIFEHTKEIFWIFHEVTRILKPGGRIIVGVLNLASLHNRFLLLLGKQPTSLQNNSAHVRGYTLPDIKQFIETTFPGDFNVNKVAGSNFYPFPPTVAKPLAKIFPSMAWAIFLMLEKIKSYNNEFLNYPIS